MSASSGRARSRYLAGAFAVATMLGACAPQRPYRTPVPPGSPLPPVRSLPPPAPPPPSPPAAPAEPPPKPLPPDAKIREQDLKSKTLRAPSPGAKEPERRSGPDGAAALPPPLPDDSSLLAKITPGVSPQRAASLRLTDEGSKLLDAGEAAKALARLERTIVIDPSNAYGYFYLAKAQYRLGRYGESLNFLAVAESRLSAEPFWLAEVHALRGENYRAQGQLQRAQASYEQALRLNSGNRTASEALARLQVEPAPASR